MSIKVLQLKLNLITNDAMLIQGEPVVMKNMGHILLHSEYHGYWLVIQLYFHQDCNLSIILESNKYGLKTHNLQGK